MTRSLECAESGLSRRSFLKATAILTFAGLPDLSFAATPSNGRLLVILLRGGMDGLFAMPPVGEAKLSSLRRDLLPQGMLKLDGFFALHPALQNIHDLYGQGEAMLVHGTSSPYVGRSHFDGQNIMESGVMQPYTSASGWLGRALGASGYQAVAMSLPVPLILRGGGVADSRYPSWISSPPPEIYDKLKPLWAADPDIAPSGEQLVAQVSLGSGMSGGVQMGDFASLRDLASDAGRRLAAADGPRVAVLDHVGFDTHSGQEGTHSDKLRDVDQAIGAFRSAVGDAWKDTLVVTVTEFGRTAAENGSAGTDHGWGTCALVLGGRLRKAGILADWPGLKPANLFEGRDLKATIDVRSLYGAIVTASLGIDPDLVQKNVIESPKDDRFSAYLA